MRLACTVLLAAACAPVSTGPRPPETDTGREYTTSTQILDENGAVAAAGWARAPLFVFDPGRIPESRRIRTREWEFYEAHSADVAIAATIAKIGLESEGFVVVATVKMHEMAIDRARSRQLTVFNQPDMVTFEPQRGGNYRVEDATGFIALGGDAALRTVDFAFGEPGPSRVEGHLEFVDAGEESVALVTPFSGEGFFFYEDKVPTLQASGQFSVEGTPFTLPPGSPGVLDWVRAVIPNRIVWTWASGAGDVNGRSVAINMGSVFGDEKDGTPNAIVVDGRIHKLGRVDWQYDLGHPSEAWTLTSPDGRVNLRITSPHDYVEDVRVDIGIVATALAKIYGTWSGTVMLDDGSVLEVNGLLGAAESVETSW